MTVVAVGVDAVVVSGVVATVAEVETMMTMVAYGKDDFVVVAAAVVGWVLSVAEERATQQDEAWFVRAVESVVVFLTGFVAAAG